MYKLANSGSMVKICCEHFFGNDGEAMMMMASKTILKGSDKYEWLLRLQLNMA